MIRCLLAIVTRNKRGEPSREERLVSGTELRLGRGAESKIHLTDPRVALNAAVIKAAEDGRLYLEALSGNLNVDGKFEKTTKVKPGVRIGLGPYELAVEPPKNTAEHDFILDLELVEPLPENLKSEGQRARTTLSAAGLSKRWPALIMFFAILGGFLVWPILHATQPSVRESAKNLSFAPDESWDPGKLAHPHQGFGKDCAKCHDQPFVQVRDQTCESCHKSIGGHVETKAVQTAAFGETRCAECHRDHKGPLGLIRTDTRLCTDCHSNVKAHAPNTTTVNIRDFATDHPHFKLALLDQTGKTTRILQSEKAKLKEKSGLKFPHDVHLDKKGVKNPTSPSGRVVMECKNCHTPDAAGVRFEPIKMEKHCVDCHRLEFEPAVTTRTVPHGDPKLAMTTLREFYSSIALGETPIDVTTVDGLLRRTNESKSEVARKKAMEWANQKADKIAADLIEDRSCAACHTVTKEAGEYKIAPVRITNYWMVKAKFEHFAHKTAKCVDCHEVEKSKTSEDIAIPDIDSCRTCHAGAEPKKNKVTSTCESCHGFHLGSPKRGATAANQVEGDPHRGIQVAAHTGRAAK